MPPTAAPMMPPFTLFLLVVAPMTAPAAAPIAASRFVCFSVTVRGCCATVDEPLMLEPELPELRVPLLELVERRAPLLEERVVVRETSPLDVRVTGAAGVVVNALPRSSAETLSSGARCCAASDRSVLSALSAGLVSFRLHAPAATRAAIASAEKVRFIENSSSSLWLLYKAEAMPNSRGCRVKSA
jgi:hypothetical protein